MDKKSHNTTTPWPSSRPLDYDYLMKFLALGDSGEFASVGEAPVVRLMLFSPLKVLGRLRSSTSTRRGSSIPNSSPLWALTFVKRG